MIYFGDDLVNMYLLLYLIGVMGIETRFYSFKNIEVAGTASIRISIQHIDIKRIQQSRSASKYPQKIKDVHDFITIHSRIDKNAIIIVVEETDIISSLTVFHVVINKLLR